MITSRVFAAIPVPHRVGKEILGEAEVISRDFPGLRKPAADDLHITIEFLGDVGNTELPRVCRELEDSARELSPFSIAFGNWGTFPGPGKAARVLWLGVSEGRTELEQLNQSFGDQVRDLGTAGNAKAYIPHLTLARLSKKQTMEFGVALCECALGSEGSGTSFRAEKVVLYATAKERGKLIHDALCTVDL